MPEDVKPGLLFVSPVVPRPTGGGVAMRAWHVLHALAAGHTVHLVVGHQLFPFHPADLAQARLPVAGRIGLPMNPFQTPDILVRRMLDRGAPSLSRRLIRKPAEWSSSAPSVRAAISRLVERTPIEVLHVFRLYMMPAAEAAWSCLPRVRTELDLDDVESETRMRLADVHRGRGDVRAAEAAQREARLYEGLEARYLPGLDRVWVCSELDRTKLRVRLRLENVGVVPNTVQVPQEPLPAPTGGPFTFLFVGSLGYFPNRAGVEWFCERVVPLLRRLTRRPFRLRVVGANPGKRPVRLADCGADIELTGFVPDVAPHYAEAGAVVVPIWAGGGTRIKVLEAFTYRRPVITTPVGVEGLEVEEGVHVLMGADETAVAEQCRRVLEQPDLAPGLSDRAWGLFRDRYHPEVVAGAVRRNAAG